MATNSKDVVELSPAIGALLINFGCVQCSPFGELSENETGRSRTRRVC